MSATRYARKPQLVEAITWTGSAKAQATVKAWQNEWLKLDGKQAIWCGIKLSPDDGIVIMRDVQTHEVSIKDPEIFRKHYARE